MTEAPKGPGQPPEHPSRLTLRREVGAWVGLAVLFVLFRVAMLVGDPGRFWAVEETYQADIALALAHGEPLEALPAYLYPAMAGVSLVDGLAVAGLAFVFGPTWWVVKGLALVIALLASATLVATARLAIGAWAALALGALLALAPPSMATMQMFLHGNHAEAALPLALSAAGLWALLERDRSGGGRARLAFALGLMSGFAVFFVYSHLLVVALLAGMLLIAPCPRWSRGAALLLGAAGLAIGLLPWVACRVYLGESLTFASPVGGPAALLGYLASEAGVQSLRGALAMLPWLGTVEGEPWAALGDPSLDRAGRVFMAGTRILLLLSLAGAVGLGLVRRVRREAGWVLPLFFGAHGLLLFLLVVGSNLTPRYAQQITPDALVALVLLAAAAWSRGRAVKVIAATALLLPLLGAGLDSAPLLLPPAPGIGPLGDSGLERFSRGRQTNALQGFRRDELPGIGAWLELRAPSDADVGFALGFPEATQPLLPVHELVPPRRIEARWLAALAADRPLDPALLLEGLGAAAVVRFGGDVGGGPGRLRRIGEGSRAVHPRRRVDGGPSAP